MEKSKLYKTSTGEFTIYLPHMDETYHSRHGAISESYHVFINYGLNQIAKQEIKILEIGFGTGLNALLTYIEAINKNLIVEYHSLEPFPVDKEIIAQLNYGKFVEQSNANVLFTELHDAEWDQTIELNPHFKLRKIKDKLESWQSSMHDYDLIYFDAFAPKKQAELWRKEQFEKLYKLMAKDAVLTTYSAAGQFKRDLRAVGFSIENPPGANGKRQMTIAIKK